MRAEGLGGAAKNQEVTSHAPFLAFVELSSPTPAQ